MEPIYYLLFGGLAIAAAGFEFTKSSDKTTVSAEFRRFRNNYVLVYSLMMAGDWLQGPFVYALYQHYGFDRGEIGQLFIAGFGSSMVFGTVVGSLADKTGRKKAALTYVAAYTFGCITKHFNSFAILFVGRIFCGIATSLLFSAFESWLVAEHFKRGFEGDWLGNTFSIAVFLGNGLVAIVAGLLGHGLVESLDLGPVAPFDAAAVTLLVGAAVVLTSWSENFGDANDKGSLAETLQKAANAIANDQRITLLGAMQSLFEASMYTFVFLWTPALSPKGEHLPHGMIFSCFMAASMVGSAVAGRLLGSTRYKPEKYMQLVFMVSAAALFVPVLYHRTQEVETDSLNKDAPGITFDGIVQLMAFCAFEVCVGVFWPSMMSMRAQYVPEEMRSTIINLFRVPLNLFVCVVLYNVSKFPLSYMFGMCALFLAVAAACQRRLETIVGRKDYEAVKVSSLVETA